MLEEQFKELAGLIALIIEAGAVAVVTYGAGEALTLVARSVWRREPSAYQGRLIWLKFATWILLALEFALAADIVRTAISPTWDDLGKLAAIAAIRTVLNYFLARDIATFSKEDEADLKSASRPSRRQPRSRS